MATPVALVGGPCDGETKTVSDATVRSGHLTCKGTLYEKTDVIHVGDLITFATLDAISGVSTGKGTGGNIASHTHKGWEDVRRSINHRLPETLRQSHALTSAALRSLSHSRKVRL